MVKLPTLTRGFIDIYGVYKSTHIEPPEALKVVKDSDTYIYQHIAHI